MQGKTATLLWFVWTNKRFL